MRPLFILKIMGHVILQRITDLFNLEHVYSVVYAQPFEQKKIVLQIPLQRVNLLSYFLINSDFTAEF